MSAPVCLGCGRKVDSIDGVCPHCSKPEVPSVRLPEPSHLVKNTRYLKQVIVMRKDLNMPTGKVAAMAAHAAMTFLIKIIYHEGHFTKDQERWLTEMDPGLESIGQVSMAKVVCEVKGEQELLDVEKSAKESKLTVHRVTDCGYAHNKAGTLVCIAIGPHWPEQLEPITGKLKLYR